MTTRIHLDEAHAPELDVTLRELLHLAGDGPIQHVSAPVEVCTGAPFPTSVVWYRDVSQTTRVRDVTITRDAEQRPTTVVHRLYAADGATVVLTVTDTLDYAGGAWAVSRSRTVAA